ncbi:hypothetical protein [Francisella philomiragia]|uniref:hypothetical protein n=1 Tax=Francisella philomiragia TaxID=28110 RepID=UPI0005A57CB1|nr:hypothetical protein [Francisella philomiragia]AJI54972.1 hypothetical protein LA56_509 [Francisella philomiragia]MBK2252295.1 hypothetical protein [Francisella philomiragia]
MSKCKTHQNHEHKHQDNCGHTRIKHGDHYDYLHDGHLHHEHNGHYDEHTLDVTTKNPDECKPIKDECCDHVHGPDCGHEAVPHGDHIDYIVDGRLHHPHGNHCDDHGPVEVIKNNKK